MWSQFKPALLAVVWLSLLTGVAYPLVVTAIAQAVFPFRANGSLIETGGRVVGSELIGQSFSGQNYFWGRPSATGPAYNGGASTGSNLGPTNPALVERVAATVAWLRESQGQGPVPVDLATASASGLDPDISPAAALYQVARVARARGLPEERVRALVGSHLEPRQLGVLGEPRVNVLRLNLDLDRLARGGASGH